MRSVAWFDVGEGVTRGQRLPTLRSLSHSLTRTACNLEKCNAWAEAAHPTVVKPFPNPHPMHKKNHYLAYLWLFSTIANAQRLYLFEILFCLSFVH